MTPMTSCLMLQPKQADPWCPPGRCFHYNCFPLNCYDCQRCCSWNSCSDSDSELDAAPVVFVSPVSP